MVGAILRRNGRPARPFLMGCALGIASVVAAQSPQDPEDARILQVFRELQNMPVQIASRVEQTLREAPAVVSVLRQEEFRLHGWRFLSDVLEQVPGLSTRVQAGGEKGLVVRGMFAPDGVLLLVDGLSINDPLNGNTAFYDFPLEGLERIEVARGPGSALYGGYAFLAVVNLVTAPSGGALPPSTAGLDGGPRGSGDVQGALLKALPWGRMKVFTGYHRSRDRDEKVKDDYLTSLIRRTTVGDRATDRYGVIGADPGLRHASGWQGDLGARVQVTRGPLEGLALESLYLQRRAKPILSRLYALVDPGELERRDDLFRAALTLPWALSDAVRFNTRVYGTSVYGRSAGQVTRPYGWDDDEDFDGITERWPAGRVEARSYLFHTLGSEISADIDASKEHALKAGLLFERTWLARTQYLTNSSRLSSGVEVSFSDNQVVDAQAWDPKQHRQDSWIFTGREGTRILQDIHRTLRALYLQDIWALTPRVSATLGLRLDAFSGFGSALSPRAVLVWNPSDRVFVKGLYGQAFKPPTFLALYDGTVTLKNERQVYGNPKLDIATIRTWEAVLGFQATPAWLIQANVFLTRTRGEVAFNAQFESYRNEAYRRTRGAEVDVQGVWGAQRLQLNYAYAQAEQGQGTGAPLYPRHQANANFGSSGLFGRMDLGATLGWRSACRREPGDPRPPLPGLLLLSAQVGLRLGRHATLGAGGTNLLDRGWHSPVDRSLADVLPGDVPRPGRALWAGLRLRY